jgi:hypothetical protein
MVEHDRRRQTLADVPPLIVPDEEAEKALHFLRDSCEELGRARGMLDEAELMLKVVLSEAILASEERSADKREADARTSPAYLRAIKAYKEASTAWTTLYAKRKAAEMWLEAWRTCSATQRAARI